MFRQLVWCAGLLLLCGAYANKLPEQPNNQVPIKELSSEKLDEVNHADPASKVGSADLSKEQLYNAYIKSQRNVQGLADMVEALSGQVTSLTNQLATLFATAEANAATKKSSEERALEKDAKGGVTYTRWGRTTCDQDASVLYKGYAAGSHYSTTGGGSDLLCLHETPQWNRVIPGVGTSAYLHGAEYWGVGGLFDTTNNGHQALDGKDVPCAVCQVQKRSQQVMIPARRECPRGWTREYSGYLLAPHGTQQRGSHTCVDEAPEAVPGGLVTEKTHALFPVEARCPGFKCPPFVDGAEVTCVVCTQ